MLSSRYAILPNKIAPRLNKRSKLWRKCEKILTSRPGVFAPMKGLIIAGSVKVNLSSRSR